MPASIRRGCIGLVDGRQHLGPKRSSGCREATNGFQISQVRAEMNLPRSRERV